MQGAAAETGYCAACGRPCTWRSGVSWGSSPASIWTGCSRYSRLVSPPPLRPPSPSPIILYHHAPSMHSTALCDWQCAAHRVHSPVRRMGAPAAGASASRPLAHSATRSAHTSQTCRQTCLAPSSWACLRRPRRSICRDRRHGTFPHSFLRHRVLAFASATDVTMPNLVRFPVPL